MAQTYKLVVRTNFGKDKDVYPAKLYAHAVSSGKVDFDMLCTEIADGCTLTSADVKAVLDRLNVVMDKNLRDGRIIQLGELGNFRITVGSEGAISEDKFIVSALRKPKIIFTPGSKLQNTRKLLKFERASVAKKGSSGDGEDRPGEL